jgi:hypothetical protein
LAHLEDARAAKVWNNGNAGQMTRRSADGQLRMQLQDFF